MGLQTTHALADLLWLWSIGRRPIRAILLDLEAWPSRYRPRAQA